MSSKPPGQWADRRGLFQSGKQVHEPASPTGPKFGETGSAANAFRRASSSSNSAESPTASAGGTFPTAGTQRRRSSAASGGLFNNLQSMKRGSQDYGDKRASHSEMAGGSGGMLSGWFNSTFKGVQKPADNAQQPQQK